MKRRGTLSDIARALGVSKVTVTRVLQGKATSRRILDEAIRRAIEIEGRRALMRGAR